MTAPERIWIDTVRSVNGCSIVAGADTKREESIEYVRADALLDLVRATYNQGYVDGNVSADEKEPDDGL